MAVMPEPLPLGLRVTQQMIADVVLSWVHLMVDPLWRLAKHTARGRLLMGFTILPIDSAGHSDGLHHRWIQENGSTRQFSSWENRRMNPPFKYTDSTRILRVCSTLWIIMLLQNISQSKYFLTYFLMDFLSFFFYRVTDVVGVNQVARIQFYLHVYCGNLKGNLHQMRTYIYS